MNQRPSGSDTDLQPESVILSMDDLARGENLSANSEPPLAAEARPSSEPSRPAT